MDRKVIRKRSAINTLNVSGKVLLLILLPFLLFLLGTLSLDIFARVCIRMSKPCVQLVLGTASINPANQTYTTNAPTEPTGDYEDERGAISRWRTWAVWKNVNFRSVLGGLYRDNQKYLLRLESVTFGLTSNLAVYATNEHNRAFNIFLQGLPNATSWMNGVQNNEVLLGTVRVPSGAQVYTFYFPEREFLFELAGANQTFANLRIELRDTLLNQIEPVPVGLTVAVANQTYQFSIRYADAV